MAVLQRVVAASESTIAMHGDPAVRDAALIAAAQEAEHDEIAAYGTLRTWARVLGRADAAELLESTLREEKEADVTLSQVAERLNVRMAATRA
jgi:ferritin-like metal-binding protein YciE